jgi:hypothetical protein
VMKKKANISNFHIIGHSLGAHTGNLLLIRKILSGMKFEPFLIGARFETY